MFKVFYRVFEHSIFICTYKIIYHYLGRGGGFKGQLPNEEVKKVKERKLKRSYQMKKNCLVVLLLLLSGGVVWFLDVSPFLTLKKKKLDLKIAVWRIPIDLLCFYKKWKKRSWEKITKWIWTTIYTQRIMIFQHASFWSKDTFSLNRNLFSQ